MTIGSSTESHQQHVPSIYKVQVTPTGATSTCCGLTKSDDTVMFQAGRQSSHDLSKTITDSLMTTAKEAAYTANSASGDPTGGRNARELSTIVQTDSLRPVMGPYSTSIEHIYGQSIPDPSTTLQMDPLRTVKGTYSTSIAITHGQKTRDPSATPQMDSLRTVKGPYSAYTDQARENSTGSLSKSPQTDSLMIRTVKGTTDYGVSAVQGSFVAVKQSERASIFQGQSQRSSFQVQPSFSSLASTISPSHTGK